jgi:hypothetical protein
MQGEGDTKLERVKSICLACDRNASGDGTCSMKTVHRARKSSAAMEPAGELHADVLARWSIPVNGVGKYRPHAWP